MGTKSRGWLHEKIHEYMRVHCADEVHSLLHLLIQRSESFCLSCLTPLNYHYRITTCHALLFWNSTDEPDHHGLSFPPVRWTGWQRATRPRSSMAVLEDDLRCVDVTCTHDRVFILICERPIGHGKHDAITSHSSQ